MVGQRLGNYVLRKVIGQGGMGVVYEAWHEQIGRRAAIKVLRPSYATDSELAARFLTEARAVNIIEHPGVVSALDFGHTAEGFAYIVMDFLAGSTLRQRLQQLAALGGRMSRAKALRLARQLAAALAAAHARGIIHRDLKPESVHPLAPAAVAGPQPGPRGAPHQRP
jgi:serine/threonine protein kinase